MTDLRPASDAGNELTLELAASLETAGNMLVLAAGALKFCYREQLQPNPSEYKSVQRAVRIAERAVERYVEDLGSLGGQAALKLVGER